MSKFSLTLHDLTHEAAQAVLAFAHGLGGPVPNVSSGQTPPPPPPTAAPANAPPPPPIAPSIAPPPAPAAPPQASGATVPEVLASMGEYAKTHKSAGVKSVLGKCGLAKVTDANAEQLIWLLQAFRSNQPM